MFKRRVSLRTSDATTIKDANARETHDTLAAESADPGSVKGLRRSSPQPLSSSPGTDLAKKKSASVSSFASPFKKRGSAGLSAATSTGTLSSSTLLGGTMTTNAAAVSTANRVLKLLLLGPGESGKSTIVKQMKILHGSGYTKDELLFYRKDIFRNLLESMQQVIGAMHRLAIQFHSPESIAASNAVLGATIEELDYGFPQSLCVDIMFLWNECGLKPLYDRLAQINYVLCSAPYFFEHARRICQPDYVPTQNDILRARIKTTGISESHFKMGNLGICLIDVGGQISERKKWIHTFENVTSIIFCVSLSEYDQVLLEDASQSRMLDSFTLFESIVNSQWFRHVSIILFLNKTDIFRKKLLTSPLSRFFDDYDAVPCAAPDSVVEFENAATFLKCKYLALNHSKLPIYPHYTCATDTQQIETVFAAVKETILSDVLKNTGLL